MHYRAAPDAREIELLRAINIEVVRTMDRIRRQGGLPPLAEGERLLAPSRTTLPPHDERNEMMMDATNGDASSAEAE